MKPIYTKATSDFDASISIRYDEGINLDPHWHYHNEYELVYIHKSKGERYVGDSVNIYHPGDLTLLGSGLPHTWVNDKSQNTPGELSAATVMHFQRKFIHNTFFDLPLMREVKRLFERSIQGIRFIKINKIEESLKNIQEAQSAKRVSLVIDLLHSLSRAENIELLSSKSYASTATDQQNEKLIRIHNYIIRNFQKKISLDTLADLAHMTPQAFCNYFKSKTRKTVFSYINELRIGHSCKLLIENNLNIEQIALASGFNNTTFFNRKFKEKMKTTPKEYRKQFKF